MSGESGERGSPATRVPSRGDETGKGDVECGAGSPGRRIHAGQPLAYLALTSKDERLLRGALARRLHREFADEAGTFVRREWPVPTNTRKRVDVAVLRAGKPVALIEAKAAMSSDLVKGTGRGFPVPAVLEDIKKLREIDLADERYALLFVTNTQQLPRDEYDPALPYAEERRRHGVIEEPRLMAGFARFLRALGDLPVVDQGRVPAGAAFDVEVEVLYWLLKV